MRSKGTSKRVLPGYVAIQRPRKHIQRPAWKREKISVGSSARFCSCADGAVSAEHEKHFGFVRRGFRKCPLNLIRVSTPRFAISHACAFKDVEHFCLGFGVAAAA